MSGDAVARGGFVTTTQRLPAAVVVRLLGELDMATVGAAGDALAAAAGANALIVDLDGLRFLGSQGMALLVDWHDKLADGGGELRIVATTRRVLRPMDIAGLSGLCPIHASVEEAVAAVTLPAG